MDFIFPTLISERKLVAGNIKWLDLSFNSISFIDPKVVLALPNLSTLYLHANEINNLSDVAILRHLTNLKSLSLYGNPIEENKHYKYYVLHVLCRFADNFRRFDVSPIVAKDRSDVITIVYFISFHFIT
jgi:Leucine-rich repeat (LRR) protein